MRGNVFPKEKLYFPHEKLKVKSFEILFNGMRTKKSQLHVLTLIKFQPITRDEKKRASLRERKPGK